MYLKAEVFFMSRRNLTNGNVVTTGFPAGNFPVDLKVGDNAVYVQGHGRLFRGDL